MTKVVITNVLGFLLWSTSCWREEIAISWVCFLGKFTF